MYACMCMYGRSYYSEYNKKADVQFENKKLQEKKKKEEEEKEKKKVRMSQTRKAKKVKCSRLALDMGLNELRHDMVIAEKKLEREREEKIKTLA